MSIEGQVRFDRSFLAQRKRHAETWPKVVFLRHFLSAYFSALSALNLGVKNVECRTTNVEMYLAIGLCMITVPTKR